MRRARGPGRGSARATRPRTRRSARARSGKRGQAARVAGARGLPHAAGAGLPTGRRRPRRRGAAPPARGSTPKRSCTRRAALGHERHHVRRGGGAGVLDEVGVLLGEPGAAHGQPAAARLVEQHSGAAPAGARVVRVLEGRAEGLDPGGLGLAAGRAHLGQGGLDGLGRSGRQRERCARHHLAGAEVRAPVGEPELIGLAPVHAAGPGHVHPLEHPREVAAVGVGVHLHRAADRARDVHPELEAGEAGPGRAGGRLREPGAATAQQPLAALLDRGERAVQLHDESSESSIRNQEVRSGAHHSYRQPLGLRPGQEPDQALVGVGAGEPVGRAARADRRQARERVVALDPGGSGHEVRLRASSSTSPAPIVRSTSPSPSSSRRKRSASGLRGQPPHRAARRRRPRRPRPRAAR